MADGASTPEELDRAVGVDDVRFVVVMWKGDGESGVEVTGTAHQYEAAGMLRAALRKLERANADTVTISTEIIGDDSDDLEDDEPEP